MKNFARVTLLSFWLFAIVVPSVITLFDVDNPVIVTNLNEEESQETGKKSQSEEKFVKENILDYSLIGQSKESTIGDFHAIGLFDYTLEVIPPPPKHSS